MKVCAKCGSSLPDGAAFCISCGSTDFKVEVMPDLNIPEEEKPKIEYDQYGRPIGQQPRQEEKFEMPHFADLSASANSGYGESLSEQVDQAQYLDGYQERKRAWGGSSSASIPVQPDAGFGQYVQPQYSQPQYAQPQYSQPQYPQPQYAQPPYGQQQYAQPQYPQQQYVQPQYTQPQYEQPAPPAQYSQPQYEQPAPPAQYSQPQYEQPAAQQYQPAASTPAPEEKKPEPAAAESVAEAVEETAQVPQPSTTIQTPQPDPDGPDPYESSKNFKFVRKEDEDEEDGEETEKKAEDSPKTIKGYLEKFQNTTDHTRDYDPESLKKNKKFAILAVLGPTFWVPFVFSSDCPSTRFYANQGLIVFILEILLGLFESIFTGIINTAFFDTATFSPVLLIIGLLLYLILTAIFYAVPIFMIVTGIFNINAGKVKDLPFLGKLRLVR